MNRISHKQAVELIDRRSDGLLTEEQTVLLEEHLVSCEACRPYAAEMESLPARLQNELHARWDEQPGPSQSAMQQVMAKARKIRMTNRISSNLRLLAGAIALIALALAINFVVSRLQQTSSATDVASTLSPARLIIDPQSCKPAAEFDSTLRPPNGLYGYKLIQGTSLVDGDFSYDFWLYCDPALKADIQNNTGTVAGLGIFSSWQYNGPQADGLVEYRYEFDPNIVLGGGSWEGPLYQASITGAKFGIDIPQADLQAYIQQGTPVQFRTLVDSPVGHKEALLSFWLEPTEQGLKIADLHAEAGHLASVDDRLIAFVSAQNGNTDIYTMHADGSGVTNLTNNPAQDTVPVWSPDGTRIAFVSDRDGNFNLYVMNADGSGLTRLTEDPAYDVAPVWSPDGTKIAYTSRNEDGTICDIYIVDSTGQNRRRLTENISNGLLASPEAWSLDGQFLFYQSNLQLSKVNINNGETTAVTSQEDVAFQLLLSKDGSKLSYLEGCSQSSAEFCNQVKSISQDGTGKETLATVELKDICWDKGTIRYQMIKWSPDQTKLLFSFYCKDKDGLFYIANADGSDFKPLTSYPILHEPSGFDWSPDSQSIVFSTKLDNAQSDRAYILNINDTLQNPDLRPTPLNTSVSQISFFAWQPEVSDNTVTKNPTPVVTPQPSSETDRRLIAFASAMEGGQLDIYTMHPDGSELTNLTNDPARDANPFWSPDGRRIAFESDRDGSAQIYVMDADGSNIFQVTEEKAERRFQGSNPWSPDGSKLLFIENASGDGWALYSIGTDGQNKTFLVQVPDIYSAPSWSPDAQHVAFIIPRQQGDRTVSRIQVVGAQGGNSTDATKRVPADEDLISQNYSWSPDGQSLFFLAERTAWDSSAGTSSRYAAYEASLDGESLTEKATSSTPMASWWDGTAFVTGFYPSTLTWLHSDGTYNTFNPLKNCPATENSTAGFSQKRSLNGMLLFNVNCSNDELWFYWANPDGTTVKQLFDFPIVAKGGGVNDFVWSLDDKYVAITIVSSGATHLYVIDVDASLNDRSLQPVQMVLYGDVSNSNIAWQPVP